MTTAQKHTQACSKYKKAFLEEQGYISCKVCKRSDGQFYSVHHLYFASLWPKHPNLHNPRNLILVDGACHDKFHSGEYKEVFKRLEEERGLKELFD